MIAAISREFIVKGAIPPANLDAINDIKSACPSPQRASGLIALSEALPRRIHHRDKHRFFSG